MGVLGRYRNGNYDVTIYSNGTKVRENDLDHFDAVFPESMDIKITNQCDLGCMFCHEDSKPNGEHGNIINLPFLDSLHEYTELAIGGGNPLSHPDFIPFLRQLKERKLIANVTVNYSHFMNDIPLLRELTEQGLIYGLGVSYTGRDRDQTEKFADAISMFPNAVIHVINGIVSIEQLAWLSKRKRNLKLLILGYKDFRRGYVFHANTGSAIDSKMRDMYDALPIMVKQCWFDTISFDNLAIKQLEVKRLMSEEEWSLFFMGDDGRDGALSSASMYVDAVKGEFARNSCSDERFPITNNITEMFQFLKKREG